MALHSNHLPSYGELNETMCLRLLWQYNNYRIGYISSYKFSYLYLIYVIAVAHSKEDTRYFFLKIKYLLKYIFGVFNHKISSSSIMIVIMIHATIAIVIVTRNRKI